MIICSNLPSLSSPIGFFFLFQKKLFAQLFYDDSADTEIRFADGKTLRFSKSHLFNFTESSVLYQLFIGDLRDEVTYIIDIDCDTFKLFVDCLVGLAPYTEENAMEIFPVAWKYQVDECLENIMKTLTPTEMNTNICYILNMTVFYQCDKLWTVIFDFLFPRLGYRVLFEKEEYSFLLTLESYKSLLQFITDGEDFGEPMDSYVLYSVLKWADNYIKTNYSDDHQISIRQFLEENRLDYYMKNHVFETTDSVIRFCKSPLGKDYFTNEEIIDIFSNKDLKSRSSQWIFVNQGETITEKFLVVFPFLCLHETEVRIDRNEVVFYDRREEDDEIMLICTVDINDGYKVEEFNFSDDPCYDPIVVNISDHCKGCHVTHVKWIVSVKWTFNYHCRILKMGHKRRRSVLEKVPLYFTKFKPKCFAVKPEPDFY